MPANHPKPQQRPRDIRRCGGPPALDQRRESGPIAFEILARAIQPLDLRRSDQTLRGERGLVRGIAHEPLEGIVALARRRELERRVRPHGLEHVVRRTRLHG